MRLPDLTYKESKTKKEVMVFGGLNLTDYAGEGEFSDCENLSVRRLPYLSARLGRTQYGDYENATAIFAWDKLVVVNGTDLIYDGEVVASVSSGEKQFAVINTKLCIWPDEVMLDLDEGTMAPMAATVTTTDGTTTTFTASKLTVSDAYKTVNESFTRFYYTYNGNQESDGYVFMTYTDVAWSEEDGWTVSGEEEKVPNTGSLGVPTGQGWTNLEVGDIIMLKSALVDGSYALNCKTYYYATISGGSRSDPEMGEYSEINQSGFYAVVTAITKGSPVNTGGVYDMADKVTFKVVNATDESIDLTTVFEVGDRVDVTGCVGSDEDDDDDNDEAEVYDNANNIEKTAITAVTADTITFDGTPFTAGSETVAITITRSFPHLDYICERDNRLWGVSNEDKTIYASALGLPQRFYDYDNLSTDSYAVAVASKGDFTGICKYSTGVLFWKEQSMIKLLGGYPAEFYTYSYDVAGVQEGSHKSLKIINETLFYKGIDGVYTYGGSTPATISEHFGEERYFNGVGGTDGVNYHIGMDDGEGNHHLMVYDTRKGLWVREDDTEVMDFCRLDGQPYMLGADGKIYITNDEDSDEVIDWHVTFAPFYEVSMGKKVYSKLFFRLELDEGAWVKAFIRYDDKPWVQVGVITDDMHTATLPVKLKRCDKFELKLEGHGGVAILSFVREMKIGTEV